MLTNSQGFALRVASMTPDLMSTFQQSHKYVHSCGHSVAADIVAGRAVPSKAQQSLLPGRGTLHGAAGQDAVRHPEAQLCRHPRVTHSHHQVPGAVVSGADRGGAQPGVLPRRRGQGACVMILLLDQSWVKLVKEPHHTTLPSSARKSAFAATIASASAIAWRGGNVQTRAWLVNVCR